VFTVQFLGNVQRQRYTTWRLGAVSTMDAHMSVCGCHRQLTAWASVAGWGWSFLLSNL